jgi:hypothetical protein
LSLGKGLLRLGDKEGAVESVRKALALSSVSVASTRPVIWALASSPDLKLRDGKSALALANLLWPTGVKGDPYDLLVFAAVQADAGHTAEARRFALSARAAGKSLGERSLVEMASALLMALDKGRMFIY